MLRGGGRSLLLAGATFVLVSLICVHRTDAGITSTGTGPTTTTTDLVEIIFQLMSGNLGLGSDLGPGQLGGE